VIRIFKGVPNNQEQIPVPPNEVVRNCAVAYDKNQQTPVSVWECSVCSANSLGNVVGREMYFSRKKKSVS
jgi:hypothetical protein